MECITVAALGMLPRARAGERREGEGRGGQERLRQDDDCRWLAQWNRLLTPTLCR